MYDEPPHMRHRGRFEDRRRLPRPDFHENIPETDRFQKRSRWSESHEEPVIDPEQNGGENKGGNTPLHDEPAVKPETKQQVASEASPQQTSETKVVEEVAE